MSTELYPGIPFSPQAALTDNIGEADTIIPVSDVSAFPDAPNLATIGTDEDGETVSYAAKTQSALSGCVRGVEGTAKAWMAGEVIARNFTAKDHNDIIRAVGEVENVAENKQDVITGTSGQVVGFQKDGAATPLTLTTGPNITLKQEGSNLEIGVVVPGKILNLNWDFRKPVNRNGLAKYTGYRYTIDAWKPNNAGDVVTLMNGCIRVQLAKTSNFNQLFNYDTNKIYTVSFLFGGNSSGTIEVMGLGNRFDITGGGLFSASGTINDSTSAFGFYGLSDGFDAYPIAAILEEGDHQTHFRQNESGEWELIDPVDYDTQYLLCSQYSPITGEWVGSQHSNQNLLHNWYFVGGGSQLGGGKFPINQHGQTEYANNQYGFDRWMAVKGQATAVGGITIESDHIHVSADYVSTQPIENYQKMQGKTYTASVLTKDNKLISGAKTIALNNQDIFAATPDMQVYMTSGGWFQVYCFTAQDLLAAKLELGPVQTLAHKEGDAWVLNDPPPDYALELMKCQRYQVIPAPQAFYRVRSVTVDTNVLYFHLPISGELRAKPAIVNSDRIQVASIGGSAIPGFSFEVDGYGPGWISVIATKNAHGLADAWLLIMNDFRYGTPVIFDANL